MGSCPFTPRGRVCGQVGWQCFREVSSQAGNETGWDTKHRSVQDVWECPSRQFHLIRRGCRIGKICSAAPIVFHDLAVAPSSLSALQKIVFPSVEFSLVERYLLQPIKSVILAILSQRKDQALKNKDISITMNVE